MCIVGNEKRNVQRLHIYDRNCIVGYRVNGYWINRDLGCCTCSEFGHDEFEENAHLLNNVLEQRVDWIVA